MMARLQHLPGKIGHFGFHLKMAEIQEFSAFDFDLVCRAKRPNPG